MSEKFTETVVRAAEYDPSGKSFQWVADGEIRGFGLRLQKNGKSFALRYTARTTGTQRYLQLGRYPGVTVAQARDLAKKAIGKVADGRDPVAEERAERERAREERARKSREVTFGDFAQTYLKRMGDRWKARTHADYAARIKRNLLPTLAKIPLSEVSRAELSKLLEQIAEASGPYDSNRTHSIVRAMYNRASQWGFIAEDKQNPARGIERYKEVPRERWLRPNELARLMAAVREEDDPYFKAFVPLLLLTGMRKGELLRAQRKHVRLEQGEILLPETKSGRPQTRKLSEPAVEILRFLPEQEGNPFLFPGRKAASHSVDFKGPWDRVRERVDLPDVTIHDLRRTAGSYMAQAGVPLQVIGDLLGHQHPGITRVYARLSAENEREAVEELGRTMRLALDL